MSTSEDPTILRPRLVLLDGGRVSSGFEIEIQGDRIAAVRPATAPPDWDVCLLPGFVNGHSHAFQRGMRGLGESFPRGEGSFFTWRASMYELVETLDPDRARRISRLAFEEMLDAGITTVGEFHYVHHAADDAWALDEAVVQAARDAGIRLVLLHCDYVRGGFDGRPLEGGQRRFDTRSTEEFLASLDRISAACSGPLQTAVPIVHSTRAVPIERIEAVRAEARRRGTVFHVHLEEVIAEIEDCRSAHGTTPMRLLLERGVIDEDVTAVHCTHSSVEDLRDFGAAGGRICLCPNTEGNLGDGIPDLPAIRENGIPISIGTDLNSRIAPTEDLRWIEYLQRTSRRMRGAVVDEAACTGPPLLRIGARHGADSLGVEAGSIMVGRLADFAAIDLGHRTLEGVSVEAMTEAIVFGTGPESNVATCVGGRWVRGGPPASEGAGS